MKPTERDRALATELLETDGYEPTREAIAHALAEAAEGAVFDFLNWLAPQNIRLVHWDKGSSHTVPEGELFERWKAERA